MVGVRQVWCTPRVWGFCVSCAQSRELGRKSGAGGAGGRYWRCVARLMGELSASNRRRPWPPTEHSQTEMLARSLFTDFVLPFEIASVLLLVAIVGAVVLAKRER